MLHIWGRISSINVRKVVWTVQHLNLTHQRTDAGGQFGIVKTPDYLANNPNALVPLLEDGDFRRRALLVLLGIGLAVVATSVFLPLEVFFGDALRPEHGAPDTTGALAKAASGALELVPLVRVVNLAQSLDQCKAIGCWTVGLAGEADALLSDLDEAQRSAAQTLLCRPPYDCTDSADVCAGARLNSCSAPAEVPGAPPPQRGLLV